MANFGAPAVSWAEQDLEKREAAAEKKRESIMVNFNNARTQVSSLEANLARTQVELEKVSFDLQAKKGNCLAGFVLQGRRFILITQSHERSVALYFSFSFLITLFPFFRHFSPKKSVILPC